MLPLAYTLEIPKGTQSRTSVGLLGIHQQSPGQRLQLQLPLSCLTAFSAALSRTLREDTLRKSARLWKVTKGLKLNPLWTWSFMCAGSPETQVLWADPQQRWAGQGRGFCPPALPVWDPTCRAAAALESLMSPEETTEMLEPGWESQASSLGEKAPGKP